MEQQKSVGSFEYWPAWIAQQFSEGVAMATIQQILDRIDELHVRLEEAERDALADNQIDPAEERVISRIRARLNRVYDRLQREMARNPEAAGENARIINFEDDEAETVEGEDIAEQLFQARRQIVVNSIGNWRDNCKNEVSRMVNSMLDPRDSGPSLPRGDIVSLVSVALNAVGHPQIATAVEVLNSLFTLAQTAYEAALHQDPTLRQTEEAWNQAMDAITDRAIGEKFEELVAAFKSEHGYPADAEMVRGSAVRDWIAFTESISEGNLLPRASNVKRDFMTGVYRAMPGDRYQPGGSVLIRFELDPDQLAFTFLSGRLENPTDEMVAGLNSQPTLFGPLALHIPAQMEFRIIDTSKTPDVHICTVSRRNPESGNTNFELTPNARSTADYSFEEQSGVYELFMRGNTYNVPVAQVL
jgi:hypothetical protein